MNFKNLWIDSGFNYFYVSSDPVCEDCEEPIENLLFLVANWGKKESSLKILCNQCLLQVEKSGVVFEAKFCGIAEEPDPFWKPVFIQPPTLIDSAIGTVFSASEIVSERVVDRTRFSNLPSLEGAQIGKLPELVASEKDKLLELEEADECLKAIKEGKLIAPQLLEDKNERS